MEPVQQMKVMKPVKRFEPTQPKYSEAQERKAWHNSSNV